MSRSKVLGVILSALLLALAPGSIVIAAEPLPSDSPILRAAVFTGTTTVAARLNDRDEASVQGGLSAGSPSGPEATIEYEPVDGFSAHEVESENLVVQIPEEWEYVADSTQGIFEVRIPGEFAFSFFDSFSDESFPALIGLAIFRSQAGALIEQIGDDVTLTSVTGFTNVQNLPGVKIVFGGDLEGLDATGAFYILAGGDSVYAYLIITSDSTWTEVEDTTDQIAENIVFSNQILSELAIATDEPLNFEQEGLLSFTLPSGWLAQTVADDDIAVAVTNRETNIAGAVLGEVPGGFDLDELTEIREALSDAGEDENGEVANEIVDEIIAAAEFGTLSDEFIADPALTTIIEGDSPTLRFGGLGNFEDFEIPIFFYVNFREDGIALSLFFGDEEALVNSEGEILDLTESIQYLSPEQ